MSKNPTHKIFEHVLSRAKDVTNSFDIDLGGIPQDVVDSHHQTKPHIQNVRERMENFVLQPDVDLCSATPGLIDMRSWSEAHGQHIPEALRQGDVVAVDGTPLIHLQRFLTAQVYACAIGSLTYQDHLALKATVVKTQADPTLFADQESTQYLIAETDRLSVSRSWPAAFMEYQERKIAFEHSASHAIIDGPLITQNLLTQKKGQELYERMLQFGRKCYVGVTKDLRFADAEERYVAVALRQGEMFVRCSELEVMRSRLEKDYKGTVKTFSENYLGNILRGIYRPGRKAFGFQCHREDLPKVVCLLHMDCHTQPGHEIPFLLEQVDSQIRGRYRPNETMRAVEAALASDDIDDFYDEAEERNFR